MSLVKHDHVFWLSSRASSAGGGASLSVVSSGGAPLLLYQLVAPFRSGSRDQLRRNRDEDDELLHSGAFHCLCRSRFLALRCPVPRETTPTPDVSVYHCSRLAVYRGPDQPTSESHLTTSPRTARNHPHKMRITHQDIPNLRINFEVQLVTFRLNHSVVYFRVLAPRQPMQ